MKLARLVIYLAITLTVALRCDGSIIVMQDSAYYRYITLVEEERLFIRVAPDDPIQEGQIMTIYRLRKAKRWRPSASSRVYFPTKIIPVGSAEVVQIRESEATARLIEGEARPGNLIRIQK
ncbi:MAG: hypothetical protein RIF32_21575 [Leptospirales bacterium]